MPNNYRLAKDSSLLKKEITLIIQNDLENSQHSWPNADFF